MSAGRFALTHDEAFAIVEELIGHTKLRPVAEALRIVLDLAKAHAPCESCGGSGMSRHVPAFDAFPCPACKGKGRGSGV